MNVQNFAGALQGIATTTLRAVIGDILLDDVLSKRDQINEVLRAKLDEQTERWGGKVTTVEIREIIPPRDVQDAMNRMLSAERNRRAVITESEGTRQANINVAEGEKQAAILRAEGQRQSQILAGRGLQPGARAHLRRRAPGRRADDDAAVPRGAQGARREPVDEVHPAARAHRARPAVGNYVDRGFSAHPASPARRTRRRFAVDGLGRRTALEPTPPPRARSGGLRPVVRLMRSGAR